MTMQNRIAVTTNTYHGKNHDEALEGMGLRCTTAINHCQPEKMATAVGTMDLWISLWQRFKKPGQFSREFHRQRKKDGNPIWLYTCAAPNPRTNFGLNNTQVPFFILDSWFRGAEGVMYYGGLHWPHAISRVRDGTGFAVRKKFRWCPRELLLFEKDIVRDG